MGIIQIFNSDSDGPFRTSLAMLIGLIARHEQWPYLLHYINNMTNSTNVSERQVSAMIKCLRQLLFLHDARLKIFII